MGKLRSSLPLAALLAVVAACGGRSLITPETCSDDSDCASGQRCNASGHCVSLSCTSNDDCAPSERCVAPGECVPYSVICQSDSDCVPGFTCQNNQCLAPTCTSDADCPSGESCSSGQCRPPFQCGDGVVGAGEECDDGPLNSDVTVNACRTDCTLPRCGDGVTDLGETCDDGNTQPGDDCSADCQICTGCPTCIVYVDRSPAITVRDGAGWATALATVRAGADLAASLAPGSGGCEVWVAGGIYYTWETSAADAIMLAPGVALYGGFAGGETVRGQRDWELNETVLHARRSAEPGLAVTNTLVLGDDTVVDGFVIEAGQTDDWENGQILALNVTNWAMRNCTLRQNAGALYSESSTGTLESCVVHDNVSLWRGAISTQFGALTVTGSLFEDNATNIDGAAISDWGDTLTVADSVFRRNVGGSAGAVSAASFLHTFSGCHFESNVATLAGGAIQSWGDGQIMGGSFVANIADLEGGAISGEGSSLSVSGALFERNAAWDGGAISVYSDIVVELVDSVFRENWSLGQVDWEGGGAVYAGGSADLAIHGCWFEANRSATGGAIRWGGSMTVLSSVFWANEALFVGGAIVNQGVADIINCTFYGNVAPAGGKSIHSEASWDGPGTSTITNGILSDESPLSAIDGGTNSATYSLVRGGFPGAGNIDGDPLFVAPEVGDFHLQAGSPCIDSADGGAAPAVDADGNPRVDDPNTIDTGPGTPPYADRGAYEFQP